MTYSPIEFKYLEARADRESLHEFILREAGEDQPSQLDLIRHLAPSILIADGYDFNELRELYAPQGLCCEHVSSAWTGDHSDDSLRCIAVRPFKPDGYNSHPYKFVQRLAGHLRDLLVRAETTPDFGNIIRHAYIDLENMERWKEAAARWRASRTVKPVPLLSQGPDYAMLATREQLIKVFEPFTGMDQSWFANLKDAPKLDAARKVTGKGGRGHIAEPWFCPYEVMLWLVDPKRKKGRSLSQEKGWELLERHFPKAYSARSVGDPR